MRRAIFAYGEQKLCRDAKTAGIDGLLTASLVLLLVALLPIHRLRASEHLVGTAAEPI